MTCGLGGGLGAETPPLSVGGCGAPTAIRKIWQGTGQAETAAQEPLGWGRPRQESLQSLVSAAPVHLAPAGDYHLLFGELHSGRCQDGSRLPRFTGVGSG